MINRIHILTLAILVIACNTKTNSHETMTESSEKEETSTLDLLVGTYTGDGSEGIYRLTFEPETGVLSDPQLMATITNPSYLAMSDNRQFVYSVSETDSGYVAAFRRAGNKLELLDKFPSGGANPCYVDVQDGLVALANYSSGNGAFFHTQKDGGLQKDPQYFQHTGKGPNADRQEGPHAHFSHFSQDGRFLYVVDLGVDQVKAYPVIEDRLGKSKPAFVLEPGDGPRHIAFDNERNRAYIVTELSNTVVSVQVDSVTATFEQIDRVSALPETFEGESYCADIHLSADGRFLYVSNRGANSITVFAVAQDGKLSRLAETPVNGDWPRNFTLSPDGKFLLVANQRSDNIVVFSINPANGLLTATGHEMALSHPVCLVF